MGDYVVIISGIEADALMIQDLSALGFQADKILRYTTSHEAFAGRPKESVALVFFHMGTNDDAGEVKTICRQFTQASVILLAWSYQEQRARELLQHGAQDYILPADFTQHAFARVIGNAIRRKQFSNSIEEHNRQLHNEIQTEKRRLDHILSSINEVVWSCTADSFEVIYVNKACFDIYGYDPDEIIGNCDLLLGRVHPEDKKQYKIAWRELLQKGRSVFEYRIFHKDGSLRYIKNEAVLRRDQNNVPRFINGFARDVTLQKMQLFRIQKQNEQLQEIAWIQSHKVRGPVATILGLAQLFNPETADTNNVEVISYLQTATSNLDMVIRDIVHKSRA